MKKSLILFIFFLYHTLVKAKNALLCVYDMNGKQLRQIALSSRGRSSVTITGSELSAGMYLYCLIVDGKLINTRRMVLTK